MSEPLKYDVECAVCGCVIGRSPVEITTPIVCDRCNSSEDDDEEELDEEVKEEEKEEE